MSRVFVALAFALAAAAPASADLPELKTRGVLRVVVAAEEAPETFDLRAESGFERELIGTFTRANGLRLEVVVARTHPERIDLLLAGKGDLIVAIFVTPERRQRVAFTSEVMPTYNLAATLAPHPAVASLDELRRLKVGVVKGTATAEDPAVAAIGSLHRYESKEAMLAALRSGAVDALVMPVSELALAMVKLPGLQPGVQVGAVGSSAWAVRKEDVALRTALDQHLEYVRKSASWNRLLVKYFGERAPMVLGRRR
ncbi:MAG TPA: transporter substrate-binding domain-containing protein [Vicinamibacteria bacterium]|nr:transporter substrate-binding domain-containing protein [Vicinamibacteria bacterium]